MKTTAFDYKTSGTPACMRARLHNLCDFALRGLESNTDVACNASNSDAIRNYHEGKAQAFREVLSFFELREKRDVED